MHSSYIKPVFETITAGDLFKPGTHLAKISIERVSVYGTEHRVRCACERCYRATQVSIFLTPDLSAKQRQELILSTKMQLVNEMGRTACAQPKAPVAEAGYTDLSKPMPRLNTKDTIDTATTPPHT